MAPAPPGRARPGPAHSSRVPAGRREQRALRCSPTFRFGSGWEAWETPSPPHWRPRSLGARLEGGPDVTPEDGREGTRVSVQHAARPCGACLGKAEDGQTDTLLNSPGATLEMVTGAERLPRAPVQPEGRGAAGRAVPGPRGEERVCEAPEGRTNGIGQAASLRR